MDRSPGDTRGRPLPRDVSLEELTQAHETLRHEFTTAITVLGMATTVVAGLLATAATSISGYLGSVRDATLSRLPLFLRAGAMMALLAAAAVCLLAEAILVGSLLRHVAAANRVRLLRSSLAADRRPAPQPLIIPSWQSAARTRSAESPSYLLASKGWSAFTWAHVFLSTLAAFLIASAIGWCAVISFDRSDLLYRAGWLFLGVLLFSACFWLLQWYYWKFRAARQDLRNRHLVCAVRLRRVYHASYRRMCICATLCTILAVVGAGLALLVSRNASSTGRPSVILPGTMAIAWLWYGLTVAELVFAYVVHLVQSRCSREAPWPFRVPALPRPRAEDE
jgi:hypothetical protein